MKLLGFISILFSGMAMVISLYYSYSNGILFFGILVLGGAIEYHLNRVIEAIEKKSE